MLTKIYVYLQFGLGHVECYATGGRFTILEITE